MANPRYMTRAAHGQTFQPLRLGIVGFGRLAEHYYVPALRTLSGIQSIIVTDPLESRRVLARKFLRAETYLLLRDLLAQRPDALLVAAPPSTHLEIWNDACRVGVPVFMEKPFVLDREISLAASAPTSRRLLMMDFNRRFWPPYQQVRTLIRSGAIGIPETAELTLHVNLMAWCAVTSHRLSPQEGGVLYDLGSQTLDLVSYIFDADPCLIEAATSSHAWEADHVRLTLGFPSGLRVHCNLAYSDHTGERVMICGSEGQMRLDDPNMTVRLDRRSSPTPWWGAHWRDLLVFGYRGVWRANSMARYSIRAAIDEFLNRTRRCEAFSPGFDVAAANSTWLEAASRSLARHSATETTRTSGQGAMHGGRA